MSKNKLVSIRKSKGYKAQEVAMHLHIGCTTLRKIERGEYKGNNEVFDKMDRFYGLENGSCRKMFINIQNGECGTKFCRSYLDFEFIDDIKRQVKQNIGKPLDVKITLTPKKKHEFIGRITEVYNRVFLIKEDGTGIVRSFMYKDIYDKTMNIDGIGVMIY